MACCFRLRVFVCLCLASFLCVLFVIYCVVLSGLSLCVVCVFAFVRLKKRVLFVIDCVMLCGVVWVAFFS